MDLASCCPVGTWTWGALGQWAGAHWGIESGLELLFLDFMCVCPCACGKDCQEV